MPDFQKKWDYNQIKKDYFDSEYTSISLYLKEKVGMTNEQVDGGQTRRKLGSFKSMDKAKEAKDARKKSNKILLKPEEYVKSVELMTREGFVASASQARLKMFGSLFNIVSTLEKEIEEGNIRPIDLLKNMPNYLLLLQLFEASEKKVLASMGQIKFDNEVAKALRTENITDEELTMNSLENRLIESGEDNINNHAEKNKSNLHESQGSSEASDQSISNGLKLQSHNHKIIIRTLKPESFTDISN